MKMRSFGNNGDGNVMVFLYSKTDERKHHSNSSSFRVLKYATLASWFAVKKVDFFIVIQCQYHSGLYLPAS